MYVFGYLGCPNPPKFEQSLLLSVRKVLQISKLMSVEDAQKHFKSVIGSPKKILNKRLSKSITKMTKITILVCLFKAANEMHLNLQDKLLSSDLSILVQAFKIWQYFLKNNLK